jgi:hypothetical protein
MHACGNYMEIGVHWGTMAVPSSPSDVPTFVTWSTQLATSASCLVSASIHARTCCLENTHGHCKLDQTPPQVTVQSWTYYLFKVWTVEVIMLHRHPECPSRLCYSKRLSSTETQLIHTGA